MQRRRAWKVLATPPCTKSVRIWYKVVFTTSFHYFHNYFVFANTIHRSAHLLSHISMEFALLFLNCCFLMYAWLSLPFHFLPSTIVTLNETAKTPLQMCHSISWFAFLFLVFKLVACVSVPCACACTKCVRKRMRVRVCVAVCCARTKMMQHNLLFFLLACLLAYFNSSWMRACMCACARHVCMAIYTPPLQWLEHI